MATRHKRASKYRSQTKKPLARKKRASMIKRKGDICTICGDKMPRSAHGTSWHHIYPQNPPNGYKRLFKSERSENLTIVHDRCNSKIGNSITKEGIDIFINLTGKHPQHDEMFHHAEKGIEV